MTLSTKERVVLIHHYRDVIMATTLMYLLSHLPKLEHLPEPSAEELDPAMKVVDKLTVDLNFTYSMTIAGRR